jgi:predicted signal transduction protein with EAL and GGDEF domain
VDAVALLAVALGAGPPGMDVLKVDRSFIDGVETPSEPSALVDAILTMARALGLHVVRRAPSSTRRSCTCASSTSRSAGSLVARRLAADGLAALLADHPRALPAVGARPDPLSRRASGAGRGGRRAGGG